MFGSTIGVYNFVHARIQEGRAKKLDATDLELYRALQAETSQRGADFITLLSGRHSNNGLSE